jgi:hypothetical protein
MAKDYFLPYQDLTTLVPQNLRNPMIKSLMDNLFSRFMTQNESVPLYGYVGRKSSNADDDTPKVPQITVERDINALIPVFSFTVGQETFSFTPEDLIRKAMVLGVSEEQDTWLYSQANNYAPPIDYDRFANFFNYYWIAKALASPPSMPWNPNLEPEYYVMTQPKNTDLNKLNVKVASTKPLVLTGSGYFEQTWTVHFISANSFTVTTNGALNGIEPSEQTQGPFTLPVLNSVPEPGPYQSDIFAVSFNVQSSSEPLLTFNIVRDVILDNSGGPYEYESFTAGDEFVITAPFLSNVYSTSFSGGPGQKGKIQGISTLNQYQTVDGEVLKPNDRVLVRHGSATEQGIYIVSAGVWSRAPDFSDGIDGTASAGARVFVTNGTQANRLFVSVSDVGGYGWVQDLNVSTSNTNNWQEGNFWVHRDDIASLNINLSKVIQATRPIIEYSADIELNSHIDADGAPSDSNALSYEQSKTEFNELPLFNLYHYDGTHAKKVSSIFFYAEDGTAPIDPVLQRRIKRTANDSADYVFDHGLVQDQSTLFYKDLNGQLHSIWHPGYIESTILDQEFSGLGNGTLTISTGQNAFSPQQIWTLTAISPNTFSVSGSKTKVLPGALGTLTVGVPYNNGLFSALISSGSIPFSVSDTFKFRLGNFETTRYVYRDENQELYDLYGGPALDINSVGAWQVPRMFYNNVAAENHGEIPEGTLYSHFRGILSNQLQNTELNKAFGGSVKLWGEQQNLLASLLMQRDVTPISMIDLAEKQYETGLNTIVDLYLSNILKYFSTVEVLENTDTVSDLVDWILQIRAKDNDVRTVLYDSTSPVIGFPATLPQLGISPLVQPKNIFDDELGVELFQHHDGHLSALYEQSPDFCDRFISKNTSILRSDGISTPAIGAYSTSIPVQPYKGQLWMYPGSDIEYRVFDVLSDGPDAPLSGVANIGDCWYHRAANILYVWTNAGWVQETNLLAPWKIVNFAELLNGVITEIENRLYRGINSEHRTYFSEQDLSSNVPNELAVYLERELNTWAVQRNFDPTAPDYVPGDAFTWNYSFGSIGAFAPLDTSSVPARWFNILRSHHKTIPGVIETSRPNIEPWKLLGYETKPVTWDAQYRATITPNDVNYDALTDGGVFHNAGTARVVKFSDTPVITSLMGLVSIDGVALNAGDIVLLVSETAPQNNGLWAVSSGGWVRTGTPTQMNSTIYITEGVSYGSTSWVLTNNVPNINVTPAVFSQIRMWKKIMWSVIQTARPSLKLSVDINRDALLPPYVSSSLPWASNALTNVIPPRTNAPYQYGDSSPVQIVWQKSLSYRYSLARALFRKDPLSFLGNCWGFEWQEVDGILYDGYDMSVPGYPRFRLHGQPVNSVSRNEPFSATIITGPTDFTLTVTHDGYSSIRAQSFSVRDQNSNLIGYLSEGVIESISANGYTLTNILIEDEGKPFRIGDTFTISGNADGSGLFIQFSGTSYNKIHGFGQTFAHALRAANVDTNQGYAIKAYRGWEVNLGYRAGGLVCTDDLKIYSETEILPESSYRLQFKRSEYADDLWAQALRITLVSPGIGTRNKFGKMVPVNAGEDWTFRIEGYNARHLGILYHELAGNYITFKALSSEHTNLEWKHYSDITGPAIESHLPITITGVQNVITFLFGYAQKLEEDGWVFSDYEMSNVDAETGRIRNWQLEIEKFVDRVYAGLELGQGHVCNPFIDKISLNQRTGLTAPFTDNVLFDIDAHPAAFDTLGAKIPSADLTVLRQRGLTQISTTVPMFSIHAQVHEFEHLFIFNNLISPSTNSGLIYDPFSGARVVMLKINGRKQGSKTLRPEFGGHYLVNNEVRQNLRANADKIARYYDADHVYEDQTSTNHALALLGFSKKQYMADLDLTDSSQFNFWRGLIQMKGTNTSINAFLNNDRFKDAKIDEYWAYKIAEYGDARSKVFPELKLSVSETLQQFTKFMFDEIPSNDYAAFAQINFDDETRWFSIDDLSSTSVSFESKVIGTYVANVTDGQIINLSFNADKLTITGPVNQINGKTLIATANGTVSIAGYGPCAPKFNPIKLLNYVESELVQEISLWHPAMGQHAPYAMENINIVSTKDPARYNVSTLVLRNGNYDPLRAWGANEVGRIWFDTTNLEYLPYWDSTIFDTVDARLSRWGTLTDYASVDVLQWVQSSVPPAEYEAKARTDAGNADLDPQTRADGTVYNAKTYVRERIWAVRPIAWSYAGVPLESAHPSFNGAFLPTLEFNNSGLATLKSGTFANLGIVPGMRIGAWQEDDSYTRPLSEFVVLDNFTKRVLRNGADFSSFSHTYVTDEFSVSKIVAGQSYVITSIGNTNFIALGAVSNAVGIVFTATGTGTGTGTVSASFSGTVSLNVSKYTDKVGVVRFEEPNPEITAIEVLDSSGNGTGQYNVQTYLQVVQDDTSDTDVILIRNDRGTNTGDITYGATFTATIDQQFVFYVPLFGLTITVQSNCLGTFETNVLQQFIIDALGISIELLDAVPVQAITPDAMAPNSYLPFPNALSNDPLDPVNIHNNGIGWRAWSVPTQLELDSDSVMPDSSWKPYVGPFLEYSAPPVSAIQGGAKGASYSLNDGSVIQRYDTSWGEWTELSQIVLRTVQTAEPVNGIPEPVQITLPSIVTADRLSVYVNGVSQLTGTYSLQGSTLSISFVPYGYHVVVIIRAYSPTAKELAFDPSVKDDLLVQRHYKIDYQYVEVPVRNTDGSLSSTTYYFWVKNRTVPATGNNLSVKTITELLINGPSQYLTFQHINDTLNPGKFSYNAVAIAGLNYLVTQDNTFKLRFTRNFTLRDDPNELDLKDTHTEWTLIRPGQRTKIPEKLWNLMVNTACASDPAGNTLPSTRRISYDQRNGTRTRYGFGPDQVLADPVLVSSTLLNTILNTKLLDENGSVPIPDYISFLDFNQSEQWFSTPESTRNTLTRIWNEASVQQINELFFAVLEDIAEANYEITDLFKTSRLSAYSIKIVRSSPIAPTYE